ncbi:MAG: methyltransferase domain-containing protein [Candidatus Eremiobacteraeota bacterium]|nr:methyltransferase domain-containing protein [Candidatus Eremiobacteraeota bacterium]
MDDYYENRSAEYHERTFYIDPSSFLLPLEKVLSPEDSILDVGCASGRDLCWLKNHGFKATGFERSSSLAERARDCSGCEVIEGDFELFDFSSLKYDALVLVGTLVHIPHDRFLLIFSKITQALSISGHVLITLKAGKSIKHQDDGRIFYLWDDNELKHLFKNCGFSVIDFSMKESLIGSDDIWLQYVLKKVGRNEQ